MRYTPGQFRDTLDLSQETLRHWRASLEPLRGARGRAPHFKTSDLLAAAVIKVLVDDCGVSVRSLKGVAPDLFRMCAQPNWDELTSARLALDLCASRVTWLEELGPLPRSSTFIVVALGPIVDELRAKILNASIEQPQLSFPPVAVSENRSARRRRS